MTQKIEGRLLAAGNVAEVFEWGSCALKLYRSPAAKRVAFREAAIHAAVEALPRCRTATASAAAISTPSTPGRSRAAHGHRLARARRGDPAADACRSYLILKLHTEDLAEPYLDAYCRVSGVVRQTILGWLPYAAAARLAGDVAGKADPRLLQLARSSRKLYSMILDRG